MIDKDQIRKNLWRNSAEYYEEKEHIEKLQKLVADSKSSPEIPDLPLRGQRAYLGSSDAGACADNTEARGQDNSTLVDGESK